MADRNRGSVRVAIAAAVSAATIASSASAQYRVDTGQVRDANNQIGAGGFNGASSVSRGYNGGNLIVTGNVTNGRAFRGSLGYTDASSFRGNLGSANLDRFYRDTVGVGQVRDTRSGSFANVATGSQAYYAPGGTVSRPPGFTVDPATGGYVLQRPRTVQSNDGRIDYGGASRAQVARGVLGESTVIGGAGLGSTPAGVYLDRQRLDVSEYTSLSRPTLGPTALDAAVRGGFREPRDAGLTAPADARTGADADGAPADDSTRDGLPRNTVPRGDLPTGTLPGSVDAAAGKGGAANAGAANGTATNGIAQTGQALSLRARAMQNNSQYAELRNRLASQQQQQSRLPNADAAEQVRRNNEQVLKNREAAAAKVATDAKRTRDGAAKEPDAQAGAAPGTGVPAPAAQGGLTAPKATIQPVPASPEPAPAATPTGPLEIKSLAAGVQDPALKKSLGEAESLMKAGKFTSAIDAFDRADAISGDDPLVFVGRGIAELGGSYYRNAEGHFRQAFAGDRALLLARFDLREMLTGERLNFLLDDLGRVANANKNDPGPLVLLAFIYYHANLPERAQKALELAQQRAGGKDELAKLFQENWTLPAQGDLNK